MDPDVAPAPVAATGPVTVLDRLVAADLSADRARAWVTTSGTRVDNQPVTDPSHPAPPPARVTLHS